MRMLVLTVLLTSAIATTQVTSSANLGCTISAAGAMACNGIGVGETKDARKEPPKLFVTQFTIGPGAALDEPDSSSDCLIIGINEGDLVNEKPPFLHVSLEKDAVVLLPKGVPYLLRNKGAKNVELRLIEIRR